MGRCAPLLVSRAATWRWASSHRDSSATCRVQERRPVASDPDGLKMIERLLTTAKMAELMEVEEPDGLAWIERGELDARRAEDSGPRMPIRERRETGRSADGASGFQTRFTFYDGPQDLQLLADARARRRAGAGGADRGCRGRGRRG